MTTDEPQGRVSLRTIAMPADTNPNGDIFGGWLVAQMDLASGQAAGGRARGRTVTVAIDGMTFHRPVKVGEEVTCYTQLVKVGRTSLTMQVEAWSRPLEGGKATKVTEGRFTFVAIDADGRPRPVPPEA